MKHSIKMEAYRLCTDKQFHPPSSAAIYTGLWVVSQLY